MFIKLNLYFQKIFIKSFALILMGLTLILYMIQGVASLKSSVVHGLVELLVYSLYIIPLLLQMVLPFIVFISSIYFIRKITHTNEYDIFKSSGYSVWSIIVTLMPFFLILGVSVTFFLSPLVSYTQLKSEQISNKENNQNIQIAGGNFWVADTRGDKLTVIKAARATVDGMAIKLKTPILFQIVRNKLYRRIDSKSAIIINGSIIMTSASIKDSSHLLPYMEKSIEIPTNISSDNLENLVLAPTMMSFWELPYFIKNINTLGLNSNQYLLYFYNLLFYPLWLFSMFLLGISLALPKGKRGGSIAIILKAGFIGFIVFFTSNLIASMGSSGLFNPLFVILGKLTLISSIACYQIISKEGL